MPDDTHGPYADDRADQSVPDQPGQHDQTAAGGGAAAPRPTGDTYEWLRRGMDLLNRGDAAAAATLLGRAAEHEPASASVLEALARARYDAGQYGSAADAFESLVAVEPSSDYAHFGLGLSLFRLGRVADAEPHLAMAAAMRPDSPEYGRRLREVRATRAAREAMGDQSRADGS